MLREIWGSLEDLLSSLVIGIAIMLTLAAVVGLVCFVGAYAIADATYKHPIQVRTNANHNYPPLIIKIKTPNGETIEATAELENVLQAPEKAE